jgi:hypothetical protein
MRAVVAVACTAAVAGAERSERGPKGRRPSNSPRNLRGRSRRGAQPPSEENLEKRYADLIESLYGGR